MGHVSQRALSIETGKSPRYSLCDEECGLDIDTLIVTVVLFLYCVYCFVFMERYFLAKLKLAAHTYILLWYNRPFQCQIKLQSTSTGVN